MLKAASAERIKPSLNQVLVYLYTFYKRKYTIFHVQGRSKYTYSSSLRKKSEKRRRRVRRDWHSSRRAV